MFEAVSAGHTVLTPNTELAAALSTTVERMHVDAGHEIWPTPRIRDFGGWLRERHLERQLLDASLPRVLTDIEERELWRSVVLESEHGHEFLEPAGAARAARRASRALLDYGIPLDALGGFATEESLALLDWCRRFQRRCRELDCVAAHELLASTPTDALGIDAPGIVWIDTPSWSPAARRWLEMHGTGRLAPGQTLTSATLLVLNARSPAAELAAIAQWGGEHLRAAPDFRAWICIPDLARRRIQVQDAFDAVLAPARYSLAAYETPAAYAVAGGTPLSGYGPVRAAVSSLSATRGVISFDTFSALLRMPDLQHDPADGSAAAVLDIALRSRGPNEATLADWLSLSNRLALGESTGPVMAVQRLQAFQRTLDAVRGAHALSRWVAVWIEAFGAGPWAERQRWSSTEFQSAERFRELLAALATGDVVFGQRSAESACRLLERAARDTAFQPQTGIPPLWISGQPMDPWLVYDGLWVAGCDEERWPPPLDPIALIPVGLQREYGVISASVDSQRQAAEELQRRWAHRATSSVFSCADAADGRIVALSPLVAAASVAAPETVFGSGVPRIQPHWHALAEHAPAFDTLIDERAPVFASPERTRGVATLKAQSSCAFRGFAETRLLAAPLERPVPGFNARERGEMLHHALEHLWSQLRTSQALLALEPTRLAELIGMAASNALETQCARRDPGPIWRAREAPRLRALLDKWLDTEKLREPFEVERLEHGAQIAHHGGIDFKVRIDRVDRLADGGRILIDYKTGMVLADWRGERPDNPQLPIYALLRPQDLVAVAYGKVNAGECRFVAEAERRGLFKPGGRLTGLEGHATFAALLATWSRRIETLAAAFAAGDAAVAPTARACASCRLQGLCRVPAAFDDSVDGHE